MAVRIETFPVGTLEANCYLVFDEENKEGIVIDPGAEGGFISEKVMFLDFRPVAVVLTHGHFDHVLGTLEFILNFRVPVLLNKQDEKLYNDAAKSAKHWTGIAGDPVPQIDRYINEGDEVTFGKYRLRVLETPGHTPGSICLYDGGVNLFSGDTLFKNGIGRTDFSYSSPIQMSKSLARLKQLPLNCRVYPGHGEATTIIEEKVGEEVTGEE